MKLEAPVAMLATLMLVEGFVHGGVAKPVRAAQPTARKAEVNMDAGGQISRAENPDRGNDRNRGALSPFTSQTLMPIRRAYDMLDQLEREFFGSDMMPFSFRGLADEEGDRSGGGLTTNLGQLDVQDTDKEYKVTVDLPGIKKDDIHMTVTNGLLTMTAERKHEHEDKDNNFIRKERSYGTVRRVLKLPDTVDPERSKIDAKFDHGVLMLTMEKVEPAPEPASKKIEIQ